MFYQRIYIVISGKGEIISGQRVAKMWSQDCLKCPKCTRKNIFLEKLKNIVTAYEYFIKSNDITIYFTKSAPGRKESK